VEPFAWLDVAALTIEVIDEYVLVTAHDMERDETTITVCSFERDRDAAPQLVASGFTTGPTGSDGVRAIKTPDSSLIVLTRHRDGNHDRPTVICAHVPTLPSGNSQLGVYVDQESLDEGEGDWTAATPPLLVAGQPWVYRLRAHGSRSATGDAHKFGRAGSKSDRCETAEYVKKRVGGLMAEFSLDPPLAIVLEICYSSVALGELAQSSESGVRVPVVGFTDEISQVQACEVVQTFLAQVEVCARNDAAGHPEVKAAFDTAVELTGSSNDVEIRVPESTGVPDEVAASGVETGVIDMKEVEHAHSDA